jgi:hypothetical protein
MGGSEVLVPLTSLAGPHVIALWKFTEGPACTYET